MLLVRMHHNKSVAILDGEIEMINPMLLNLIKNPFAVYTKDEKEKGVLSNY